MPKYLIDYSVIVNAIYINGSWIKEDPFILPSHNVAIHYGEDDITHWGEEWSNSEWTSLSVALAATDILAPVTQWSWKRAGLGLYPSRKLVSLVNKSKIIVEGPISEAAGVSKRTAPSSTNTNPWKWGKHLCSKTDSSLDHLVNHYSRALILYYISLHNSKSRWPDWTCLHAL